MKCEKKKYKIIVKNLRQQVVKNEVFEMPQTFFHSFVSISLLFVCLYLHYNIDKNVRKNMKKP